MPVGSHQPADFHAEVQAEQARRRLNLALVEYRRCAGAVERLQGEMARAATRAQEAVERLDELGYELEGENLNRYVRQALGKE